VSVATAKEVRFERFGGLNLRDDDIADHEARDLLNVIGKPRGGTQTRDGSSRFASAALTSGVLPAGYRFVDVWPVGYQKTTSLHSIGGGIVNKDAKPALFAIAYDTAPAADGTEPSSASAKAITVFGDGTVVDHGSIVPWGILGSEGTGRLGVATGPGFIFIQAAAPLSGGPMKIGGANDTIQTWTASAGSVPQGNLLRWWSGRMIVTAINGQAARVVASNIGDANDWGTGAGKTSWTVDLEPGDGDAIVGWAAFETYLFVFKRRRFWRIYDGETGANAVVAQLGATSRFAIAETPYGVVFQARDYSLWLTTGTSVRRLSANIDPWLNAPAALGYADHLYVSVPSGIPRTPSSGTFDYDFVTDEWRCHSFVATQFATQDFDDGAGQKLFGLADPSTAGKNLVRYFDPAVNDDLGTAYDSYWASPHHKFGTEVLKRITELRVEGTGQVDVSFSKERAADSFQRSLSLNGNWDQKAVLTPGVARSWGFKFAHSGGGYMSLDAFAANVKAKRS
jgi:hypothetical protein